MHTTYTPELARQIVNDRLREAQTRRLARFTRRSRNTGQADAAGSGSTERVVRRAPRASRLFQSDIIGAR